MVIVQLEGNALPSSLLNYVYSKINTATHSCGPNGVWGRVMIHWPCDLANERYGSSHVLTKTRAAEPWCLEKELSGNKVIA
jgi:hypothetical protein